MTRRPPRSTRTDTLFPYTDALPISAIRALFGAMNDHTGNLPPMPGVISVSSQLASCWRSEEHTSELQSLMRISYAVFCLKKKKHQTYPITPEHQIDD